MYLLGESKVIISSPSSRKSKNRIKDVISNSLIIKIAPFLKDWQLFSNEYCDFNVIDLLLEIAVELENQFHIDTTNDFYLIRRASERYFVELENYLWGILDSPLCYFHAKDVGNVKHAELFKARNNYRREVMIPILSDFKQRMKSF
ncbi:MAG TPA: hypothetical protein VFJ51_13865 [Nitrososphaeraceae archaeon]|nr:hypothetical protein [Nitrososphaeraceae archaeon]